MTSEKNKLVTPIYLNQRLVFDLFAMIEDGISTVAKVTSETSNKLKSSHEISASASLSEALSSLFKVQLGGRGIQDSDDASKMQRVEERVHTPSSLFFKIRKILAEQNQIIFPKDKVAFKEGDIIEFEAIIQNNPVTSPLQTMLSLMETARIFGFQAEKGKSSSDNNLTKSGEAHIQNFLQLISQGETVDLLTSDIDQFGPALLTLERQFLKDLSDLLDGKFKVLGKVTRILTDNNKSISLLRRAAIANLDPKVLNDLLASLSLSISSAKLNVPEIEFSVKGPAFQLIPIAIFC